MGGKFLIGRIKARYRGLDFGSADCPMSLPSVSRSSGTTWLIGYSHPLKAVTTCVPTPFLYGGLGTRGRGSYRRHAHDATGTIAAIGS
jgi:hypothetical protein